MMQGSDGLKWEPLITTGSPENIAVRTQMLFMTENHGAAQNVDEGTGEVFRREARIDCGAPGTAKVGNTTD